jgi:hypothetical protein
VTAGKRGLNPASPGANDHIALGSVREAHPPAAATSDEGRNTGSALGANDGKTLGASQWS